MKTSDIDDQEFLCLIDKISREKRPMTGVDFNWVFTWDLAEALPNIPIKVIQSKCRKLFKRKLLDGCPCGCRGDWELTARGLEFVRR